MRETLSKGARRRRIVGVIGLIIAVSLVLLVRRYIPNVDALVALLHTLGDVSPGVYVGVYALTTLLLVPLSVMIFSAGLILGTLGIPVLLLGTGVGCAISFLLGRGFFRESVLELTHKSPKLRGLEKALRTDSFRLTLLARMSPVMPFAFYNYAAGASPMSLPAFSLSTLLGLLPRVSLGVLVGSGGRAVLEAGSLDAIGIEQYLAYGFGLVTTLGVTYVLSRLARRALAIAKAEGQGLEGGEGGDEGALEAAGQEP